MTELRHSDNDELTGGCVGARVCVLLRELRSPRRGKACCAVDKDLRKHLSKISDYRLVFGGGGGDATAVAVNYLRAVSVRTVFDERGCVQDQHWVNSFVNKYVLLRELANLCDDKRGLR